MSRKQTFTSNLIGRFVIPANTTKEGITFRRYPGYWNTKNSAFGVIWVLQAKNRDEAESLISGKITDYVTRTKVNVLNWYLLSVADLVEEAPDPLVVTHQFCWTCGRRDPFCRCGDDS